MNRNIIFAERQAASRLSRTRLPFTIGLLAFALNTSASAQNCSQFNLTARPSNTSIKSNSLLQFTVRLTNNSDSPVTIVSRELPNTWSISRKAGGEWISLSRGGLVRGAVSRSLPEQTTPTPPDLFPSEEYKRLPPGGSLDNQYDLTDELRSAMAELKIKSPIKIRIVLGYKYQASADEAHLGMLQCDLETAPVDIQVFPNNHSKVRQKSLSSARNGFIPTKN